MVRFSAKRLFFLYIIVSVSLPIFSLSLFNLNDANNSAVIALADETPDINLSVLPQIDYNAINQMWYTSKVEMLIITPKDNDAYYNACIPLRDWKNEKGVKTIIKNDYVENSSLYGGGTDTAEMIRSMIKWYYDNEDLQWVLLVGDVGTGINELPIREVYNPDVVDVGPPNSEYSTWNDYIKPTDFYYADLTGNWNEDGDGNWGESSIRNDNGKDEIEWTPEVYVGRLPANSTNELEIMINKTLKYETNPTIGAWMNRMLLAGGISDVAGSGSPPDPDGEDESRLTTYIWQQYTSKEMGFKHLEAHTYYVPPPPKYTLSQANLVSDFHSGYSTVIIAGHGTPFEMSSQSIGVVYNDGDAASAGNIGMPSLVYGDACTTSSYDKNDGSIGERLIKEPNAGAIGYIGGLRVTWYLPDDYDFNYLNRANARLFFKEFFENRAFQQGKALYDSKVAYLNSFVFENPLSDIRQEWQRKNILTYNLLGDPEVDIYTKKPGNLTNYFSGNIYEGQLVKLTIMDNNSRLIPYARVNLKSTDGKYHTEYADINGDVFIQLPKQVNESFNVTITGHNLLPQFFNFTTKSDVVKPELVEVVVDPDPPTVSRNIYFNVETIDTYSGIESVYVFLSDDNFNSYNFYTLSNATQENEDIFEYILNKLDPGEYSYLIVARDYANNTDIFYSNSYVLSIPTPLIDFVLIIIVISIFSMVGISVYFNKASITKHKKTISRLEYDHKNAQYSATNPQEIKIGNFCPQCGRQLINNQKFCDNCGSNVI
jgi:hypothetical protein